MKSEGLDRAVGSDGRQAPGRPAGGRLARFVGMARAGAGVALGTLERDPIAPLERAVDSLANLRGLATKVGQMAGFWAATLPPGDRARAERVLSRLRTGTQTSAPAEVRALIEAELGAPIATLFVAFDEAPFASASIGQVHRATLHDGTEVAVKAQHPGIDAALRADLDNAAAIGGVAALLALPDAGALVDEVRARIEDELDYRKEASTLLAFEQIVAEMEGVRVPRLVPERSSARVLTTHLVLGGGVGVAASWPTARTHGRAIRRFLVGSWLEHGLLFADPHAGNWIFHEDGTLTVLDFGCVIPFPEEGCERVKGILDAITCGSFQQAEHLARACLGLGDTTHERLMARVFVAALAPLQADRVVRATDIESLSRLTVEAKRAMLGRRVHLPPWLPLTLRALVGTSALLVEIERGVVEPATATGPAEASENG